MDLTQINVVVSLLSAAMMFAAIIFIITYGIGSFSSRPGEISLKFVVFSLFYFLGSPIFLIMGVDWLTEQALLIQTQRPGLSPFSLNIGASALAFTAVLNIFCGIVTVYLYLRGNLTLNRALNNFRRWLTARK
jgi:hypothetical protein